MPEDPLVGKQLGAYQIETVIGKGGMATVYRGIQTAVNRVVAIKVLPSSFLHDDTFMIRFRQEAEVAARLEHIHILPVYDFGEQDGVPYIVMRYIDGGTLRERCQEGPVSTELTVRIVSQVADALDHAHARNIIHRDLKPSNVMLDAAGNAYLMDFGTAKLRDRSAQLTGSGIVGTPAYMAPEQSMPGQVTPQVDVYALGVTLFETITGHVPYSADTPIVQILMHIQHPVPSLLEYNPTVPPAVDAVVSKAMAKRPEDRFARAGDLADALRSAVDASGGWSVDFEQRIAIQTREEQIARQDAVFAGDVPSGIDDYGTSVGTPSAVPPDVEELGVGYAEEVGVEYPSIDGPLITPMSEGGSYQDVGSLLDEDLAPGPVPYRLAGEQPCPALVDQSGEVVELATSNILIGRDDHQRGIFVDIDLTPLDVKKRSSRSHARILERDGVYIVWDLESMNGTYVNGRRLAQGGRQELVNGDVLTFGRDGVTMVFQW